MKPWDSMASVKFIYNHCVMTDKILSSTYPLHALICLNNGIFYSTVDELQMDQPPCLKVRPVSERLYDLDGFQLNLIIVSVRPDGAVIFHNIFLLFSTSWKKCLFDFYLSNNISTICLEIITFFGSFYQRFWQTTDNLSGINYNNIFLLII